VSDSVTLVPVTRQTTDGVLVDGLRKEHIECEYPSFSPSSRLSNQVLEVQVLEEEVEMNSNCSQESTIIPMNEVSDSVTLVPVTRQTTDGVLVDGLRKEHIECEYPVAVNSHHPKVQISKVKEQNQLSNVVHESDNLVSSYDDGVPTASLIQIKRPNHIYKRSVKKPVNGKFECEICNKFYSKKSNLKRHMQTKHSSKKPFICRFCGAGRSRMEDMKHHMIRAHPDQKLPYECENCKGLFKEYHMLHHHKRSKKCKNLLKILAE